jgi:hypothetical protein
MTMSNDQPKGSEYLGRSGDTARVAFNYSEQGQAKATVFDYHISTKTTTGEDSMATNLLGALQAECG